MMMLGIAALLHVFTAADLPVEAPLPSCAVAMDEPGRYSCGRTFDETLDFYRKTFIQTGGVRWRNIISTPNIKARHIDSLRSKTHWEGINVYEKAGEVRIYVLPRESRDHDKKK